VRVVLLGPPGVGKGTQGRRLTQDEGWALISTGEMLREAGARGTPLGLAARRQMDAGRLVGDDVMIGLVRERTLEQDAARGFVLDGFPRTVPQAVALDAILAERDQALDAVVCLRADESEIAGRLTARRECPTCKRAYNLESAPPRDGVHCDDHPTVALVRRADDEEATIRERFVVYREQTAPLAEYYRDHGRLTLVDGTGDAATVYTALRSALGCADRT
jgi:adenylate kinase